VILKVGDESITHEDLYRELNRRFGSAVLNEMAENMIVEKEAQERGIEVDEDEIEEDVKNIKKQFNSESDFQKFLHNQNMNLQLLKRQFKLNRLKKEMIVEDENIDISKEEIKDYFEKNKKSFSIPRQIRVSHILLSTEEQAKDVIIALDAGADFEKMAKPNRLIKLPEMRVDTLEHSGKECLFPGFRKFFFQ